MGVNIFRVIVVMFLYDGGIVGYPFFSLALLWTRVAVSEIIAHKLQLTIPRNLMINIERKVVICRILLYKKQTNIIITI